MASSQRGDAKSIASNREGDSSRKLIYSHLVMMYNNISPEKTEPDPNIESVTDKGVQDDDFSEVIINDLQKYLNIDKGKISNE